MRALRVICLLGVGAALASAAPAHALAVSRGLPAFGRKGFLPPGMHATDVTGLRDRYATTPRRRALMVHLEKALSDLGRAGWSRVYIGGSFVSEKADPGDVDVLVPRQKDVDWPRLVRVAKREQPFDLSFYGARKIVTNALEKDITPAQRQAWALRKPDFLQFFSQNRAGEQVGMVVVELRERARPDDRGAAR